MQKPAKINEFLNESWSRILFESICRKSGTVVDAHKLKKSEAKNLIRSSFDFKSLSKSIRKLVIPPNIPAPIIIATISRCDFSIFLFCHIYGFISTSGNMEITSVK